MSNIVAVLIVRCTHTGVYADGRPNLGSVTVYDLDEITIQKNRTRYVPIPPNSVVDIPMSTRTFVSWHEGDICKFTRLGLITSEIILQLRDKGNCGGPAGTGQSLRPAVLNVERVDNELRMVIPDNVIPTILDSLGFLVGEPVEITGLTGAFRQLNGSYLISEAVPGAGLAGAEPGSYLVVVPSEGPDIAATTLAGVNLCLTEGRVTSQFNSNGDTGGLGPEVFGYIGGQLFPNAGGGAGTIAVFDDGVLIDGSVSAFDFIGAGVTVTSAGAGAVDVTIPGGGGAPDNAEYVVMSLDASLTDERVLTAGTGIALVDGGAGGNATLSVDSTLAEVLANGNSTGGTDIIISTGDTVVGQTDLVLDPGAGVGDSVIIDGLTWPDADGAAGDTLTTDGAGNLSFQPPGGAVSTVVSQVGHGFVVSNAIYYDGVEWVLAQADSEDTIGTHLVTDVPGVDTFVATQAGRATTFAGLTPGVVYFVSATVAGDLVTTDPSSVNRLHHSNPILLADSTTSGWILPWRAFEFEGSDPNLGALFSYDAEGNVDEITYSDATVKTLTYDVQGRLSTVEYLGVTKTLSYNPDDSLASVVVT